MKYLTIFCDIDGTLFKYREFDELLTTKATLIDSVYEYLNKNHSIGSHIVMTTARPEELRKFTENELSQHRIPYNQLVMGIGRGARVLINDHQKNELVRAIALPLIRDEGIVL